jgi:hypothetical protein
MERSLDFAARKLEGRGGIVIIVDCDWENCCPAEEGPLLLKRALATRGDVPIAVVLAKREFEAWFLAATESLRGKFGLPGNLESPAYPESIRGAKEWLTDKMPPGRAYAETTDQPAFAAVFDMNTARRADSFDKCYRDIKNMLEQLRQSESI